MKTLSVCMIVKNEEDVIARCLNSVKDAADEIIIVDTGSTDDTKNICKNFTEKIYDFNWIDDFAAARNFSFSKATCDYVMWLDADDVIDNTELIKLNKLKESLTDEDVVMCKYNISFDTAGKPTFSYYRERILKREKNFVWEGRVHEVISPRGKTIQSDFAVSHKKEKVVSGARNLNIYKKMQKEKAYFSPRSLFYFGRELYYHNKFAESAKMFNKFLATDGWYVNKIDACEMQGFCYQKLNKKDEALKSFIKSLSYDIPHAEICVDIGNYFYDEKKYKTALYWYQQAQNAEKDLNFFVREDCYNYIPLLQSCVCYYHLGDYKKAIELNDKAGLYKPDSPQVLANKKFFNNLIKKFKA